MKIGKYKIKFNYGILRGFLDVIGLLVAYVIYQITYAFIGEMVTRPNVIIQNIFPDGVPLSHWLPGLIFPAIAVVALIFSVVYMFIPHRAPKSFVIDESNAQKYYDTLMIANSIIRILAMLALFDYTYIHQSNLMYAGISWLSPQLLLDIAVGAVVVYILHGRVKKYARHIDKKPKNAAKADLPQAAEGKVDSVKVVKIENIDDNNDKDNDKMIMRS